jgi:PAS domain S-box-containing protein
MRTVLIVEDNEITRKLVRVTLVGAGYTVLEAPDGQTAIELTRTGAPDLILQDLLLPDIDGFDLLIQLRALPEGADIPIVAFSGFLSRLESARALAIGFTDFLTKPLEPSRLLQSISPYLPVPMAPPEQRGRGRRILVADDDPMGLKLTGMQLKQHGFDVVTANDGAEALRLARQSPPDAILSDVLMPNMDGFQLCLAVREDSRLERIPVILCSANYVEDWDQRLAKRVGASGMITRTPGMEEAIQAVLGCLEGSVAPTPQGRGDLLEAERIHRVVRQLERQVSINAGLVQRASLQAAVLSLVAGLPDSVARTLDIEAASGEALANILDAGGVSMGAIYLIEGDGPLKLQTQSGFVGERSGAADMFGYPELFAKVAREAHGVVIPSTAVPEDTARDILARAKVGSAVIMPLSSRGERLGVLLLASQRRDLAHKDWLVFARSISSQLAQTIALGRAFARLAASESRYRNLFDNTPIGLFRTTPEGEFIEANPALVSVLGCSDLDTLLTHRADDFYVDPEDGRTLRASVDREGTTLGFEVRLRRHDGMGIWGRVNLRAISEGGRIVHEGSIEDVTDRRGAEAALRETTQRLQAVVDAAPVAIIAIDKAERVLVWSKAATRLLGWTEAEVLGQQLPTIPDEGRKEFDEAGARHLRGEATLYETQRRRKDGSLVDVIASTAPLSGPDGSFTGALGMLEDITERKQLEEQLRQAVKMEGIGRLAGGVAHDFNNLLTVIGGRTHLLLHELPADHPMRQNLVLIQRTGERAAALTRQLLAFSRKQILKPVVLNLNDVVNDVKSLLERLLGEDVELIIDLDPALGRITADPGQVEQVIVNLAVNARDAMPGGGRLTLETRNVELDESYARQHVEVAPGAYVALSVSDTGIGMDLATQARIFEPFFTTKEVGKGTGLGLSTAYGIVKQSNGHVTVNSELRSGTIFRIYLPKTEGEAAAPVEAERESSPRGSETVLLVEDDPDLRDLAREILETQGHTVLAAQDVEDALRIAEGHKGVIQLLITDVVMPQRSGRALADMVRRHRPNIRVLFMSGYTDDAIVHHGVLDPGTPFLSKPFTPGTLARKVREVLDGP